MREQFDWDMLSEEDYQIALGIIGKPCPGLQGSRYLPQHDLLIAPDGQPYLWRWHLTRQKEGSVYFHIQVADDPERPLHDHPFDNFSVILSGGYTELLSMSEGEPTEGNVSMFTRSKGDTIFRKAAWPHRLLLPSVYKYTMTIFSTGPKVREWGFWYPNGWVPYTQVTKTEGGKSVHMKGQDNEHSHEGL